MGVDGVKIVVDGHERSITDKDGYYKLDQVTSSCYLIEAKKEHYTFDKLKDFLVLPNMASVVDIKAVSYDVCGIVQMISSGYMAKVALTHGPENVKPRVKPTDESGSFCFEVPSGEYRLSALAANPESSPGLLFLPTHVDVVVNSPVLNVEFYQAQVNVLGEVACKEKCGSSVSVTFVRLDGKSKEERKTVYLTDESSEFLFPNVFPGKYKLEVKHTSPGEMSGEDQWCWEQSSITVEVGTEDVKGIAFVQKGYWANVISTHDVDAYMTQPDGSYVNLRIKPIYLKGEKYLLGGQIHVDSSSLDGVYELPENILVDLVNNEGPLLDGTVARLVGSGNDQSGFVVYEYSVWANPGEKLTFAPQDSRYIYCSSLT
ncbi:hypothetical protein TEA_011339 [Camellia sinensis var. sinensis]|uniref:Carbohydrate-binding-like fold protein n=1 Tax=Camellia sinensis var. sinensis TaxID=542762 RepID=A0A4S4DKB0_CAMSN|nr:hypothetical protein TEA_011339 [Camellia sinensis var. sinensis]